MVARVSGCTVARRASSSSSLTPTPEAFNGSRSSLSNTHTRVTSGVGGDLDEDSLVLAARRTALRPRSRSGSRRPVRPRTSRRRAPRCRRRTRWRSRRGSIVPRARHDADAFPSLHPAGHDALGDGLHLIEEPCGCYAHPRVSALQGEDHLGRVCLRVLHDVVGEILVGAGTMAER